MADYKPVQRQVQIMALLAESRDGLTITKLHQLLKRNGFEISSRTIHRDMRDLSVIFPICTTGTEKEPHYQVEGFTIRSSAMGFEDMQAFMLLRELAKPYEHLEIGRGMKRFLEALYQSMPERQQQWFAEAAEILTVNPGTLQDEQDVDADVRRTVESGINRKICVKIRYHAFYNNTVSERVIEPIRIEIQEGCYHLWAYCREKNEIRDFRMSRIQQARMTELPFQPRLQLLEEVVRNRFSALSSSKAELMRLRFRGFAARYMLEYHRNQPGEMHAQTDGTLLFERMTGITPDLVKWILGFGADVEVLEPKSLRGQVKQALYDAMRAYVVEG